MSTPRHEALAAFARLFPELAEDSWSRWMAVLQTLTPEVRELVVAAGRGSGKSRMAAFLCAFAATRTYETVAGEDIYCIVQAPSRAQAALTRRYVEGFLRSRPELEDLIESTTKDEIRLKHNVVVEVVTASMGAARGRSVALAIIEEASMLKSEESSEPDVELLRSVGPALGRVPGSLLCIIGSPFSRRGVLFDYHERFKETGKSESNDIRYFNMPTRDLNPRFDQTVIDRAYRDDPLSAASEYGGLFRQASSSYVEPSALDAVIIQGRTELPPDPSLDPLVFVDAAGGGGRDSFCAAVSALVAGKRVLLATREYKPPFSPQDVISSLSDWMRTWGVLECWGDRFSGGFVVDAFSRSQITYQHTDLNKSALYTAALPLINSQQCELLDSARLRAQILGLEVRTSRGSARLTIDHGAGASSHDDLANAALGSVVLLNTSPVATGMFNPYTGAAIDDDGFHGYI